MTIKRNSQNSDLLVHMVRGNKLTRLSAFAIFGVQNITARISELRKLTHEIRYGHKYGSTETCGHYNDRIIKGVTKLDANGQEYASYSIPDRSMRVIVGRYLAGLRKVA
jgi:hypothetical protein